jgi:hypothetical protein
MDEFERWFLVVYTSYLVLALLALAWQGTRVHPRRRLAATDRVNR